MDALAVLPDKPTRDQIERFEALLLEVEAGGKTVEVAGQLLFPVAPLETWHHFADGLVARTIRIEAGRYLTGAPHKAEHLNICAGDIEVWTEQGMRRLTGYHVIPSLPGAKRVGRTFETTYWTTVHLNPGNERDIEKLEDAMVENADMLQSRRLMLVRATNLAELT